MDVARQSSNSRMGQPDGRSQGESHRARVLLRGRSAPTHQISTETHIMRSDLRKPVVLLTADEEHDLIIRAQAGDIAVQNELIERNIPFLLFVATRRHRACRHRVDRDDLAHAGCLGFIRAIEKFEIGRGRLITYAQHRVRSAIDEAIDQASLLRIPSSTLEKINRGEAVRPSTVPRSSSSPNRVPLIAILPGSQSTRWIS